MVTTRILFLLPSLRLAGAERQVVDLVNALPGERYDVHLLTFERELDLLDSVDRGKVKFHNHPRRYKLDFSPVNRIAELIDRERIDIIHCTLQIALLFGFLGSRRAGRKTKLIDAIHTTFNRSLKYELHDRLVYVPLMRRCDRIIAVCDNQRKHWAMKYPFLEKKLVAVHNGIDTTRFRDDFSATEKMEIRQSLGVEEDAFIVGMVAGFRQEKGHEYAFHALRLLLDRGHRVKLMLVGDGDRRVILNALAEELGIGGNIIWLGFQREPKRFMALMDILLMSSYAVETFSMAILESLSMGKPVVATDIGGTGEMIIDGVNGFLVNPREAAEIADKVACMLNDRLLLERMAARARETVEDRFTVREMASKTELVIREVVGN